MYADSADSKEYAGTPSPKNHMMFFYFLSVDLFFLYKGV